MKILVNAKPRSRREGVEQLTQSTRRPGAKLELIVYKVSIKVSPVDGKANEAIVRLLADHFQTLHPTRLQEAYNVRIISGQTSKQKIVEVDISD